MKTQLGRGDLILYGISLHFTLEMADTAGFTAIRAILARLMRQKAILFVSMLETAASRSWRLRSAKRLIRVAAAFPMEKKKKERTAK